MGIRYSEDIPNILPSHPVEQLVLIFVQIEPVPQNLIT